MRIRPVLLLVSTAAMLSVTACSTPGRRAEQHAAVFGKLSHDDQKLVLHGHVRPGMSKDAVYIAWGAPDWRLENGTSKQPAETWIYQRQLSTYAPMNSYDQVYAWQGAAGPQAPWNIQPGFGYGGVTNTGFLYSPRAILTDVRIKRADFSGDQLTRYEVRRGAACTTVVSSASGSAVQDRQVIAQKRVSSSHAREKHARSRRWTHRKHRVRGMSHAKKKRGSLP